MMIWSKSGIVFRPDGSMPWAKTHAMAPTPVLLSDRLRVYMTCRDADGISRPGYVDLDPDEPTRIIRVSPEPLLDVGQPGTFDENGVVACSVVHRDVDEYLMYYVGFELGLKIPYRMLTGLAVSRDGGEHFIRIQETPILERSDAELYLRCGPFALWTGDLMRLWYVSGRSWMQVNGKDLPVYEVRYLESPDGIKWGSVGSPVLSLGCPDEHGYGRPWVVQRGASDYQLFYSVRKLSVGGYRLGYAESHDGLTWTRANAELNLDVSPSGFDSKMISHMAVINVGKRTYGFYNGNDFGRDGFALAELQ